MEHWPTRLTPLDRFLNRFTRLRPGEGGSVVAFFTYALLMMVSYYILKTIREPLLLSSSSAEMKSYAYAATALIQLRPNRLLSTGLHCPSSPIRQRGFWNAPSAPMSATGLSAMYGPTLKRLRS